MTPSGIEPATLRFVALHVPIVLKSGSLVLLEPSGPVRACNEFAFLPLPRLGWWSTPCPGRFAPGKDPVPIVQEGGWAPGPVCKGSENLAPYRESIPGPSSP